MTRTRSQIGKQSRARGAKYEREIARQLFDLTGITFARNLEQTRTAGEGDLLPDDDAWPFLIECKNQAEVRLTEWRQQAVKNANKVRLLPVVIYRPKGRSTRVSVPLSAIGRGIDDIRPWPADEWAEISLEGFAFLAAEIMAWEGAQ